MHAPTCAQMPSYTKGMHTYTCTPPTHTHKGKINHCITFVWTLVLKNAPITTGFFFSSSRLDAHSFAGGQENSFYKAITKERHAWRKLINPEAGKG